MVSILLSLVILAYQQNFYPKTTRDWNKSSSVEIADIEGFIRNLTELIISII